MERKLQIFVSSTYNDLLAERQACVETILRLGHIPAGMELFAAGNEGQLEIIKRWIEECDIYILILGGRYGSLEPKSGDGYTEIEYKYAQQLGKPMFALVISDKYLDRKIKKHGRKVLENENVAKYNSFKELALSKISRFFSSESDIRISIAESLAYITKRFKLAGWIKAKDNGVTTEKGSAISIPEQTARAVSGNWSGTYHQSLNEKIQEIKIFMTLEVSIAGDICGKATVPYQEDSFEVNLKGFFYLRSFLKLEYENTDQSVIQFGSFVLRLHDRPNKLTGQFVGYGHISEKVISGPIELKKDKNSTPKLSD